MLTGLGSRSYTYDAFGNETEDNTTDENPFRYCGEFYHAESGLIYLRNRYYDPSVGRFISEDPAKDGSNWYVYCAIAPYNPLYNTLREGDRTATISRPWRFDDKRYYHVYENTAECYYSI